MSYDSRCYDLAECFLADQRLLNNKSRKHQLAEHIQQAIEQEIAWMNREEEVKGGKGTNDGPAVTHGERT